MRADGLGLRRQLVYYLKNLGIFAVKCQMVLAMCAKAVYNKHAIL